MTESQEWWSTFFSGLAIEFWASMENVEATRREVDALVQALGVAPGARVLDVPCGNGRHTLELAARGFEPCGVDISPENIASARERARARALTAAFEVREMRELAPLAVFDAAFCFGNSFGYLSDEGNAEFLRAVARALRAGAKFVLETGYIAESILPQLEKRSWYQVGDLYYNAERRHDALTSRLEVDYTFIRGAQIEKKRTSSRVYTCLELLRLFEATGFTVLGAHSSLSGEPYVTGSRLLYVTAAKR